MADGILTVTGFGDFRKLHAEYNKLNAKTAELERKLKDVTSESKRNDKAQTDSIDSLGRRATTMLATYASVQQAIQMVNASIREQIDLQARAVGSSTSVANAQVELSSALGPRATDAQRIQMIRRFQDLGVSTGFGEADMLRAASVGFSATSGAVNDARANRIAEVLKASNAMFRAPEARADLGDFAGVALNVQDAIPGMTGTEAVDVLTALRGQARITDTGKIKNLVPAIIASVGSSQFYGAKPGSQRENALQMASMVAKLGQMIADDTGELSRTGGILFDEVLREFAPDELKSLPILDLAEAISKGPENVRQKIEEELKGRGVTKIPQKGFLDFADRILAREDARSIRPELEIDAAQSKSFRRFNIAGTEDIRRTNQLRLSGAEQERSVRSKFAGPGAARALLFGGEFDGGQIEGEFRAVSGQGLVGVGDFFNRKAARAAFEGTLLAGGSPADAAYAAVGLYLEGIGERARETRKDDIVTPLLDVVTKIQQLTEQNQSVRQAATTAANAQNAAAAAAQAKAQQE